MRSIVVGTRGSSLALAQTRWVIARLKEEWTDTEFKLQTIPDASKPESSKLKALEDALVAERIDIAVHNLKDLGLKQPDSLEIASIPKRLEARDALVGRAGCKNLLDLAAGARVGVNGAHRLAFLRSIRADLELIEMSGNAEVRLEALGSGQFDAFLIAASDLMRLELRNRIDELINPELILPAAGQGAIALEARGDDDIAIEVAYSIHHHASDDRITAERAFLEGLLPKGTNFMGSHAIGALASITDDGVLTLEGAIAAADGSKMIRATVEGEADEAEDLGFELAEDVLAQGGAELIKG
jgi:hydroxymethylbilane synthase